MAAFAVPQVEGRARGDVEQRIVADPPLDVVVYPQQRVLEVVRDLFVELPVLLVGHLRAAARPQGRGAIDRLLALPVLLGHADRQRDMVGVLAHDGAQAQRVEKLVLALAQVQDDLGTAGRALDGLQAVFALPVRFPPHAVLRAEPRAPGVQGDPVGDDERGIETDAELPDQACILGLVPGETLEELARAGTRDGADVLHHFGTRHADAVVGDGDRAPLAIDGDAHRQVRIALVEGIVGQGLETQFVARVGGIGDHLAQEDLTIRVQRVDHEVQQLPNLGLEAEGFLVGLDLGHHRLPHGWDDRRVKGRGRVHGFQGRAGRRGEGSPDRRRGQSARRAPSWDRSQRLSSTSGPDRTPW